MDVHHSMAIHLAVGDHHRGKIINCCRQQGIKAITAYCRFNTLNRDIFNFSKCCKCGNRTKRLYKLEITKELPVEILLALRLSDDSHKLKGNSVL